ncbi:MAG TPA: hypothetical protein VMK66_10430 [Myxococcales bacterium]|nr:hypothetical protein [Myxococcales bacterium]
MKRLAILLLAGAFLAACSNDDKSCAVVRDCPSTQRCLNGKCVDPGGQPPSALGEACGSTVDCASGLTCQTPASGFVGGFCTASCSQPGDCPGSSCTAVGSTSFCMPACTADPQCRQGYGCCASLGNVCVPLAACTSPACTRPVVASALPSGQVQQFGTHKVGDTITFDVPPGTGSLTIVHQAVLATLNVVYQNQVIDNSAVPLSILQPDGGKVYDDLTFNPQSSADGGTDSSGIYAFYGGLTPSTAAFTIPNTTGSLDGGVPSGNWKFVVNDYANECLSLGCNDGGSAENTYDVQVVTRQAAGATLDAAFYIVTTSFSEANAGTNATVQRMVGAFKNIYAQAGITANVVFHDVSATDKARFGTHISATATGPCDEFGQLFTLSGAHPGNTMNLFLVDAITDNSGSGGVIVGIDGTIPGPSSYNGTVASGAVVSAADLFGGTCGVGFSLNCGADRTAYIAAHETGHFLGLFHTTELQGSDFDPIADTAKCPCIPCASATDRPNCLSPNASSPVMSASRCVSGGCGGGDNLMFWILDSGISVGNISPQQAQVMRLNPLIH